MKTSDYEILLIGDLHYDNADLHPGPLSDVTRRELARNLAVWREAAPALLEQAGKTARGRVDFTIQLGDFVQGDFEREELHRRGQREILDLLRAKLPAPLYLVKGNHDIRGEGAQEAFDKDIIPYLEATAQQPMAVPGCADYAIRKGRDLFLFCDGPGHAPARYAWMEKTIESVPDLRHLFIVCHYPAVLCDSDIPWCLLMGDLNALDLQRKMLTLLTRHNAIVLCAHTHTMRQVFYTEPGTPGRITQIALFSMPVEGDNDLSERVITVDEYLAQDYVKRIVAGKYHPVFEPFFGRMSDITEYRPRAGFFFLRVEADGAVKLVCHSNGSPTPQRTIVLAEAESS